MFVFYYIFFLHVCVLLQNFKCAQMTKVTMDMSGSYYCDIQQVCD